MDPGNGTLGTFAGVFTPSILTILGIILFLRLGYVTGSAGFGRMLVIMTLANAISVLTSISLSAIATNLKVKGGGDYYLISRTLGLEFGGAIGLVLFLAQSVSIAFYCIGFGEAIAAISPGISWLSPRLVAATAVLFLFIFAWLGADWATRFQYLVMAVLAAALFSFFMGGIPRWEYDRLIQNLHSPATTVGFWAIFAIFFPAVTGFTQGISMSGDLKNPARSLPLGTFLAVGFSILVYFGVVVVFSGVLPNQVMSQRYDAMNLVARWGFLIDAGVIAATLSSAMASFLGAPRILQSLSSDRIFKFLGPFAAGSGPGENPRRGVLLSGGIALLTVMLGRLNLIAPLVSMFFLISYGLLNYATYYEARSASPSFRPKFRWFDKRLSLLGFLTCLGVMLAIDPRAGIVSISILLAVYHYLKRTAGPARWSDSSRGYHLQLARENLLAAAADPQHPRDWRPLILAMTNDRDRRPRLLTFAAWIEGGSGLTGAVRMIEGDGPGLNRLKAAALKELSDDIQSHGFHALPLVIGTPDILEAVPVAIQSYGIGPLKANTLLVNWFGQLGTGIPGIGAVYYVDILRSAFRQGLNLIIFKYDDEQWQRIMDTAPDARRIDIWWRDDPTSRLMLLLAHLMRRDPIWSDATIRVLSTPREPDVSAAGLKLQDELGEMRIDAGVNMVAGMDMETVIGESADAAMVFLPFRISNRKLRTHTDETLERLLPGLPAAALVMAREDIDLDAEPEKGVAADQAAAADTLAECDKKALLAEKEAVSAKEKAAALMEKLQDKKTLLNLSPDEVSALHADTVRAITASERAIRGAAKAKARASQAAKDAADKGVAPS
jgi:amino acid transporter